MMSPADPADIAHHAQFMADLRAGDPARHFAVLLAPASARPALAALYAFNLELARAGDRAEEAVRLLRIAWLRDALNAPLACGHLAVDGFRAVARRLPADMIEALIEGHFTEAERAPFVGSTALNYWLDRRFGALFLLASTVCDAPADDAARDVGLAAGRAEGWALCHAAAAFHTARGWPVLPPETDARAQAAAALSAFRALQPAIPAAARPAFLTLARVPAMIATGQITGPLRQRCAMLAAAMRGRI